MSHAQAKVTADSSSFQKAMKAAVLSMKELSSQYSLASTQAKMFGSTTDALKAKIEELKAKISAQTNIVKLNEDRQKELAETLGKQKDKQATLAAQIDKTKAAIEKSTQETGENSDETKALKEELAKLEKEEKAAADQVASTQEKLTKQETATNKSKEALAKLEGELKKTNAELKEAKWQEFAKGATDTADVLESVGTKLMAVTTAVVGIGVAAVKTTMDFDSEMSKVRAISGATDKDFQNLRATALELGASTKYSATECAEGLEYMALAGWDAETACSTLPAVLNLAAAADMDLGRASDIVTDYLTAFGLSAEDAGKFVDQMAYAMSHSNTDVDMLGEAYKNCAATAGSMGYAVNDVTAVLMTMANAGIKGGEAGTALNAVMSRLATDTKGCATALKKYGVEVYDAQGNMNDLSSIMNGLTGVWGNLTDKQQANLAKTIAGQSHYSAFMTIMAGLSEKAAEGGQSFNDYSMALENCDGTAEDMAKTMQDNLAGQLTTLKSTIEGIAIQIGDLLMPKVREVVAKIQEWAAKFRDADEGTKKMIITIAGVAAAIGPVLLTGAKVLKGIVSVHDTVKKLGAGLNALKVATAGTLGPFLAIAAVVAALVLAFKHLWDTNEGFRTAITSIWQEIQGTVGRFIEGIRTRLEGLGITFDDVVKVLKTIWNGFCDFMAPIFEGVFQQISNIIERGVDTILGIIDVFAAVFKGDWSGAWNAVKKLTTTQLKYLKKTLDNGLKTLKKVVNVFLGWFGTDWNSVWSSATSFFKKTWQKITTSLKDAWKNIVTIATTAGTSVKDKITKTFTSVKDGVTKTWTNVKDTTAKTWNNIKTTISDKIDAAKKAVSTATEAIKTTAKNAWTSAKSTATTLWEGIRSAIATKIDAAKKNVSTAADAIKSAMKSAWDSAKSTATTLWEGIRSAISSKIEAAKAAVSTAVDKIKGFMKFTWSLPSIGTTILDTAKTAVSTAIDKIKGFIKFTWSLPSIGAGVLDAAKKAVSSAVETLKNAFNFSWSLPNVRLPHFYVNGGTWPYGLGGKGKLPSIGINWYKTGAIMQAPMIFGAAGGKLLGGGEAGPEAILPLEPFYKRLIAILDEKLGKINTGANVAVYVTCWLDGDEIAAHQVVRVERHLTGSSRSIRRATV